MRLALGVSALFLVCFARPLAAGQQNIDSATIAGIVEDATEAAIPAASVSITNLDRNQVSRTMTDERGRFRLSYLPVGRYGLSIEQPGFVPFQLELSLTIGQVLDLPITLMVSG